MYYFIPKGIIIIHIEKKVARALGKLEFERICFRGNTLRDVLNGVLHVKWIASRVISKPFTYSIFFFFDYQIKDLGAL